LKYVTFPSTVVASSLNCFIMRSPELSTGVTLLDEDCIPIPVVQRKSTTSNEDGDEEEETTDAISWIAARQGVLSTTASRAVLQIPYFITPLLLSTRWMTHLLQRHPTLTLPVTSYLIVTTFGLWFPAATATIIQNTIFRTTFGTKRVFLGYRVIEVHTQTGYDRSIIYLCVLVFSLRSTL
jgi:hypothetical protein